MKDVTVSRLVPRIVFVCAALLSALCWASGGVQPARAAAAAVTNCGADDGSAGTLRAVIAAAAAGDTVTFACDGTISLTSTLELTQSLAMDGAGHRVSISGGNKLRVLQIDGGATVALNDLTISGGDCLCWGGGIINGFGATLRVTNSAIINNSAGDGGNGGYGGGIFNGGTLSVSNSTFFNNSAKNSGGAIWNNSGTVNVTNSTFWYNFANGAAVGDGGGDFGGMGTTVLANTIMADTYGKDCLNGVGDLGGNFADDATCGFRSSSSHNSATGLNLQHSGGPSDNGGPTGTVALLPGSAAIGAGVASICNAAPVNGLDQRGFPRSSSSCDSGAYDTGDVAAAPIAVTVSGAQSYGSSSPTVTPAYTAPAGAAVTGSVSCTTVNGGTAIGPALAAGSATIDGTSCSGLSAAGYTFAYTGGSFVVSPAPLTVRANDQSMVYGTSVPPLTVSYSGFINGDSAGSLGGTLSCSTTAAPSVGVGTYPIACSGQTSSNYSITYINGTLTITRANQMISFGQPANHAYGEAPFAVSATTSSGLVVSFAAGGNCTVSGSTVTITGAGGCTLTAAQPGNTNYNAAPSVPQSFSIARAVTSMSLASSANPSVKWKSVTFTAMVKSSAGTPGGTVTFKDGSTVLGTGTLSTRGVATFTTMSLGKGTHSITAVYGGNANFGGSTSAVLSQTVK